MSNVPLVTMLTVKQTAERINLPEHFIRRLCWEKKIFFIKAGSKYLINWERFLQYLTTGESESPAPTYIGGIRDLSKVI